MKKILLFLLGVVTFTSATAQVYTTIAAGNWDDATKWAGGNVPSSTIQTGATVNINHRMIYNLSSDMVINGNLLINDTLRFPNNAGRNLTIETTGLLRVAGGGLIMPVFQTGGSNNSGNLENKGHFVAINSKLEIAQNLKGSSSRQKLENSCLLLGENYINSNSIDTLNNVCIESGFHGSSNFSNDGGTIRMNNVSILMRGSSGNFENNSSSSRILTYLSPTYAIKALKVVGNLTNNGIWNAPIDKYCVDGSIQDVQNANNKIDFTRAEDCSSFSSCDCNAVSQIPLPVTFKSFTVTRNRHTVKIDWTTVTETNNHGFHLQRNTTGHWEEIAFIPSMAANGNSAAELAYTYQDVNTFQGMSQYRLRQIDHNGSEKYSSIRTVKGEQQAAPTIIYPNPSFNGTVNIDFNDTKAKDVAVIDMNGKTLYQFKNVRNSITLEALQTGIYNLQVTDVLSGAKATERIVIKR